MPADTARLRALKANLSRLRAMSLWGNNRDREAARWALAHITKLESIPNQIDGLAKCAQVSDATERTTLLLKLAAAEQRIADRDREIERLEAQEGQIAAKLNCAGQTILEAIEHALQREDRLRDRLAVKDAALTRIAEIAGNANLYEFDRVEKVAQIAWARGK